MSLPKRPPSSFACDWTRVPNFISRKQFANFYGLSSDGRSPKNLKLKEDSIEAEVKALFRPQVNKNGYRWVQAR